jgi:hypothetical protein
LLRFARNDEQTKTPERFSTPASCWFQTIKLTPR